MWTSRMTLLATTLLALIAPAARAEIDWNYLGDKEVKITSGGSTLTFQGTAGSAANSTGVVLYNMTATSSTPNDGVPDHFDKTPFSLTVSIIDELARTTKTGNELGTFSLSGFFTGDMTKGSLTNWAVDWETDGGSVTLGNDIVGFRQYDVKVDGFIPPSPNSPTSNGFGVIHANVIAQSVKDGTGVPPTDPTPDPTPEPSDAPEPSTLLLAGLGLSTATIARLRRRKSLEDVETVA